MVYSEGRKSVIIRGNMRETQTRKHEVKKIVIYKGVRKKERSEDVKGKHTVRSHG
jgi:hypothetical protein